ncbi:glycine-rich domain-containing protein [Aneurinibacillus sp. REN35]|uniref:hypothetical protein n=1 Tax=Aneurinibacillus sp. REN35 TaxID=3237286 RepID=UPI0035297B18
MDWSLLAVIFLSISFIAMLMQKRVSKKEKKHVNSMKLSFRKTPKSYNDPVPERLGLLPHVPLYDLAKRLDEALNGEFGEMIKARIMAKHPAWTEKEYEWLLFEWKRYFIMASLFTSVPMYSDDVDEIWHEMLVFTREYEKLCFAVAGEMVHHEPHGERKPDSGARAAFDVQYGLLYEIKPASWDIWGPFFRHPLPQEIAHMISKGSIDDICTQWLRAHEAVDAQTKALAQRLQDRVRKASAQSASYLRKKSKKSRYGNLEGIAVAGVVYSLVDPMAFQREMDLLLGMEMQKRAAASSSGGSSCGSSCSGSSGRDCSDSSTSGCSSSSCGSSCGGGCGSS